VEIDLAQCVADLQGKRFARAGAGLAAIVNDGSIKMKAPLSVQPPDRISPHTASRINRLIKLESKKIVAANQP